MPQSPNSSKDGRQRSSYVYRFPKIPTTNTVATTLPEFLQTLSSAFELPNFPMFKRSGASYHRSLSHLAWLETVFSRVFVHDQVSWLLRSLTRDQRREVTSLVRQLLSAIDARGLQQRCWRYYRSLLFLALFCAKQNDIDLDHIFRLCRRHVPHHRDFVLLQYHVLLDAASSHSLPPQLFFNMNAVWVRTFPDFAFSQSDWEQFLQVLSDYHLYDDFNHLYRDMTDVMTQRLKRPSSLAIQPTQSYDAFVNAILSVGIYHKGMPRDRYEAFIEHVMRFYQRHWHVVDDFSVLQSYCLKLNRSFQLYISHVLTKACPSDHRAQDHMLSSTAVDRILQLWLRLRMIDVMISNEDDLSPVMLSIRDWLPFPMDGKARLQLLTQQCHAFLDATSTMVAASGNAMAVQSHFHKAYSVLSVALMQLACHQLLQADGLPDSLLDFKRYLLFFDAYQDKIKPWLVPEFWLDAFENLIEPHMHTLSRELPKKLSHATDPQCACLLTMADCFLHHVQRHIGSSLQPLHRTAGIRMSHFTTCATMIQSLYANRLAITPHVDSSRNSSDNTDAGLSLFLNRSAVASDARQAEFTTSLSSFADLSLFSDPRDVGQVLQSPPESPFRGLASLLSPIFPNRSDDFEESIFRDRFDAEGLHPGFDFFTA